MDNNSDINKELDSYVDDQNKLEKEIVSRARDGSFAEAHQILCEISVLLKLGRLDSPYFEYLEECLDNYAKGISLECSFNLNKEKNTGGVPKKYSLDLAAVDALLRHHGKVNKSEAEKIIGSNIVDNRDGLDLGGSIRRLRKEYDLLNTLTKEKLLSLTGEYRQKVVEVLSTL